MYTSILPSAMRPESIFSGRQNAYFILLKINISALSLAKPCTQASPSSLTIVAAQENQSVKAAAISAAANKSGRKECGKSYPKADRS